MIDAVYKLYPQVVRTVGNVAYDINGNEIAYDEDAVKSYADTYAYINKRIAEYPSIQEQLDMQYWDKVNNTNNWEQTIQSVKSKYPKP